MERREHVSTYILNSVARGWVCGVLKPHGPRKPTYEDRGELGVGVWSKGRSERTVMAIPVPIRAGKLAPEAPTVCPPFPIVSPLPPGGVRTRHRIQIHVNTMLEV